MPLLARSEGIDPKRRAMRPTPSAPEIPQEWQNWPDSQPDGPQLCYRPHTLADLVAVAKVASRRKRLRASGSRWSASGAARADDRWVDTAGLRRALSWDLAQLADERPAGSDASNLVLVEAGIKLHELATQAWQRGKSIPTLGGSLGQSLAGAISTGTHGSDIARPPLAGMVRAIHLVTPGGEELWLEHPDHPVASRDALSQHYAGWHDSMRTRRRAGDFEAALVSVGRCGFVYAYVLELEPAFKLSSKRIPSTWGLVRQHLVTAALSGDWENFIRTNPLPVAPGAAAPPVNTADVYGLEVALNPDSANGQAWWTARRKELMQLPSSPPSGGLTFQQQAALVDALAIALDPTAGINVGGALGTILRLLRVGLFPTLLDPIRIALENGVLASSEDVFNVLSDFIFASQVGAQPSIGPNYEITSGTATQYAGYPDKYERFWKESPKGQFTEIFFDATRTDYLNFIDEILGLFRGRGSGHQAGYVAIRFMGPTRAPLGMQRWPVTVSVEVLLLDALDPNAATMIQQVNTTAARYDVRYHWGMTRPGAPSNVGAERELAVWRRDAAELGIRANDGLSSDFSRASALEPWEEPRGVAVSSWAPQRMDVFVRGKNDALWHRWSEGRSENWEELGGVLSSAPAAVSWGRDRIDVFARGRDDALWHTWYDRRRWHAWHSLGGKLTSAPTVASWEEGRLDIFARGEDGTLQHMSWEGRWSAWNDLGGTLTSAPAAVSWGPGRIDVFGRGANGALWHRAHEGNRWDAWHSLGGRLTSAPAVASWDAGRLDIFARGTNQALWHTWWDGSWGRWEDLGGTITSAPGAVSRGDDEIDVVARGRDGAVWHKRYDSRWGRWSNLGGFVG